MQAARLHRLIFGALIALLSSLCFGQPAEWWNKSTYGFRSAANLAKAQPSATPRELSKGAGTLAEQEAAEVMRTAAKAAFRDSDARIVVVARNGRILFEDSAWHVSSGATPLGFSMSKSLTSMAVGKALCSGHLQSLDDALGKYVPQLADTSWGRATIREVLTMTSGAIWTTSHGWSGEAASKQHADTYSGHMQGDYLELMRASDEKLFEAGEMFRYSNYDTLALALLVEQATGIPFADFFAREVWSQAGTKGEGTWLRNRNGQTAAYVGFSATPADWVRLAHYVLDQLEEKDSCFGKYMREATTKQIGTELFSYAYGYQVWTDCAFKTDAFCFTGFGGQLLIISPKKRLVLYAHSVSASHSVDKHWLDAFSSAWAKLEESSPRQRGQDPRASSTE